MAAKNLSGMDKGVLDKIEEQFPGVEFVDFFNTGSTARVYHVRLPIGLGEELKVDRIVKVFRNDIERGSRLDPNELFRNEITKLISVCHNNVISVYSAGYIKLSERDKLPYYIMEFLPGARDLDKWLKKKSKRLARENVIRLLLQAAHGIEALHEKGIIHCDLKFGNMLIGEPEQLKIADLGFAKYATRKGRRKGLYTSYEYLPQCYSKKYLIHMVDKRQAYVELPGDCVNASFDLHYFGRIILQIAHHPAVQHLLSDMDQRTFKLIADRLNLDDRGEASLPMYDDVGHLIFDLEKMQSLYLNRAGIEELSSYTGTRTIRIPVSGSTAFPPRVAEVTHHPMFFRLNNVQQLGFTHYVFPGATHTRLEHSIGVFSNVSNYINSLLADDYQPYFRQFVDQEMIATALLAGLLHDVGQHSFSHSLEDVGITERHETVAQMFITGKGLDEFVEPDDSRRPLKEVIKNHWKEVQMDRLCWLISGIDRPKGTESIGWDIVRAILSGPIDADKTDYLIRDAHHAGVEYARSIDITRFMNSLTVALLKEGEYTEGVLAITWKGKQSAENILLARSQMFWVLYWHHAVRCAHAMLANACASHLAKLSKEEKRTFNEVLYWGAAGEFLSYLGESESDRARQLAKWISVRRLFKRIIELNYAEDEEDLYTSLLNMKDECINEGDKCLTQISRSIAEQINQDMIAELPRELTGDDIIVDIPKAGKDKLGRIYVVEKGAEVAVPYVSRGLIGSIDDWQNRVRTIRIFIDPDIDVICRRAVSLKGKGILRSVCSK